MHEHIQNTIEYILNNMSKLLGMYTSVSQSIKAGSSTNTLQSIIKSKDNSINTLLGYYQKIYPGFKIKIYKPYKDSLDSLYSKILATEKGIIETIDRDLLPNIPAKNHEGIYTMATGIKLNSEGCLVKLRTILSTRSNADCSLCLNLASSTRNILNALEQYEILELTTQIEQCKNMLEGNKEVFRNLFHKTLILHEFKYGDSYKSLSTLYNVPIKTLLQVNSTDNPYDRISGKFILIIKEIQ